MKERGRVFAPALTVEPAAQPASLSAVSPGGGRSDGTDSTRKGKIVKIGQTPEFLHRLSQQLVMADVFLRLSRISGGCRRATPQEWHSKDRAVLLGHVHDDAPGLPIALAPHRVDIIRRERPRPLLGVTAGVGDHGRQPARVLPSLLPAGLGHRRPAVGCLGRTCAIAARGAAALEPLRRLTVATGGALRSPWKAGPAFGGAPWGD